MKVKELIKILELCDPDSPVFVNVGTEGDAEYRRKCAKVELAGGECLEFMDIKDVNISEEKDNDTEFLSLTINAKQSNYPKEAFEIALKKFDELYQKK